MDKEDDQNLDKDNIEITRIRVISKLMRMIKRLGA